MLRRMLLAFLLALLFAPVASAGHGFYLTDPDANPGPRDIRYMEWETDGETTQVELSGDLGDALRHVLVLAGQPGAPVDRYVRTGADHNGSILSFEGTEVEAEWTDPSRVTVHWQPPLAARTCVLVAGWVGDLEDVAGTHENPRGNVEAVWDEGRACSKRERLNYAAQCGHPAIPAYCSPGPGWPAALVLVALAAATHRRFRA